jgi:hypothetical protein
MGKGLENHRVVQVKGFSLVCITKAIGLGGSNPYVCLTLPWGKDYKRNRLKWV